MQYIQLKQKLQDFTLFSLADIKQIDNLFHRRRLNEWQEKGYLVKIIRGYYIFSDLKINENTLFEIANKIYRPSYISFESALSYYGLIPESVYGISSASSRRTYAFKTKLAEFTYRSIKPKLFFGYDIIQYDHKNFKIASVEKALLDYFYLNSSLKTNADFASLRMNKDVFLKTVNKEKLFDYLGRFRQKNLTKRIEALWVFLSKE